MSTSRTVPGLVAGSVVVMVALTVHEVGLVTPIVMGTLIGVACEVLLPVCAVPPGEQVAVQLTTASCALPDSIVTWADIADGLWIVSGPTVQVVVLLHRSAVFALAVTARPTVMPPAASRPLTAAMTPRRRDFRIINCLSASIGPLGPHASRG